MFSGKRTTKHCCYGTCRSDSRYGYLLHMVGVKWFSFPKPHREFEKCKRWVHLCGRKGCDCQSGSSKDVNEEDSTEISAQNNVEHVSDIQMLVVLNTCATETSNIIEMENTTHINSSNAYISENSKQIVNKLPYENESTSSIELLNSSNVHIAENSKQIVNKLPSEDESTSSRELLKDILQTVGVHLNIPPFLKGRKKFSVVEEVETRKIAKARIHVERVIGRMKVNDNFTAPQMMPHHQVIEVLDHQGELPNELGQLIRDMDFESN